MSTVTISELVTVVFTHPSQSAHAIDGHPERPARVDAFLAGLGDQAEQRLAPAATPADIDRVHVAGYSDRIFAAAAAAGMLDADTYAVKGTPEAALHAAGAAIAAVTEAVRGGTGMAAMRPPGHHALPDRPMGFCLLANGAIAVRHAQYVLDVGRVAVIDWDVHHGNGTQAIFYEDPSVLAVSLHQHPHWPYSGAADETGTGAGRGTTLNVPIAPGTGHDAYLARFRDEVLPAVERYAPDLVMIACGVDAHRRDPLAGLELEDRTFGALTTDVRELCERLGIGEPALVLEGGYDLVALGGAAAEIAAAYSAMRRT
jgi:acetoin utilization deacetylase AcuC-like enzyme